MARSASWRSLLFVFSLPVLAQAQSNVVVGRDLQLFDTWAIRMFTRGGAFPNGRGAIGAWTTCCNPGNSGIPFHPAMSPDHAFIHFIVTRLSADRLVQISNWSYVKHTFGSSNDPSTCGNCVNQGISEIVEVGCADTYANSQAVDHYLLGPPGEVDPWLGTWNPVCSHFDAGEPLVATGQRCDGVRSLSRTQANALNNSINHQMVVWDDQLNVPGASFFWQAGYLCPGELDANRTNNFGSRQFTANWGGTNWSFADGTTYQVGTVLQRWPGASITSNSNGVDDGRFYVAVKVTGPTDGFYHYEYAIHNRDNKRGLGGLRIPTCPTARVRNFGFHDVDRDPLNDWTGSVQNGEISFSGSGNPLRWNSIFNFWFDCDAAPVSGSPISLDQADPGPGALTVIVSSTVPGGLFNENLGPGCGIPAAPSLIAVGTPSRASLGNLSLQLRSDNNLANAFCAFVLSNQVGTTALSAGCTLYSAGLNTVQSVFTGFADGTGRAFMPLPVPNLAVFEGAVLDFQEASVALGGAYLGAFNASNGLRVRVGNLVTACP